MGHQYLEALAESDNQKSEYSLTQHLANNLIDMYINLPSKNHYRRPATYTSKGYRTRRMAVDMAVPLITNVKVAKLLAEALVRKMPLEVSSLDYKTSHTTHTFPGLVNIMAFAPTLLDQNSQDIFALTQASLRGGFVSALVMPVTATGAAIIDGATLDGAHANATGAAHCNYAFSVAATANNVAALDEEIQAESRALFLSFTNGTLGLATVAAHLTSWPAAKPVVTDARGSDLASVLLLASLHNRSIHVTDVRSRDDLLLIRLSKDKGMKVTCDVSVYALFFAKEQFEQDSALPSTDEQRFLWDNLSTIDAFSIGSSPYALTKAIGKEGSAWSGVEDVIPLLLSAVTEGRLTLKDIAHRFGGSHAQRDLFAQVHLDALIRSGHLAGAQNILQPQVRMQPESVRLRRQAAGVYAGLGLAGALTSLA